MRTSALTDVAKILAFIIGSFLLAALISSPLYEMGKGFAELALKKDTAGELSWLAKKAAKAEFSLYFKRALMLSAVALLFPLIYSLRPKIDPRKLQHTPWSLYLPPSALAPPTGQPLTKQGRGIPQLLAGFLLASGLFMAMAWLLFQLNWFQWRTPPTAELVTTATQKAARPAIIASLVEEFLFRGALLGIFLRAFRPSVAITLLSILFAAVHFLQPQDSAQVSDPRSIRAGFEMLLLIGQRFSDPQAILYEFVSLLLVGLILAHARWRTASLWLPIGLHAGWVFALKTFTRLAERRSELPKELDLYIGDDLKEGLLPIATLLLTWLLLIFFLRLLAPTPPRVPDPDSTEN